jgi:hypothetical protein
MSKFGMLARVVLLSLVPYFLNTVTYNLLHV